MVQVRQSRSRITTLQCDNGRMTTSDEEVKAEVLKFYASLLGTADDGCSGGNIEQLSQLLSATLMEELQSSLVKEVTKEENYSIIKSMSSNKTPA